MKIKFDKTDKPEHIPDELYHEARAMKMFFSDEAKYKEWIASIAKQHETDTEEAEKAAITGIVKAHQKMVDMRGEEQAEWFKDHVGLDKFFVAYEEFKGEQDGGKH